MRAQVQVQSERLARGPANEQWARIDPIIYLAEGRRRQARAMAEALGAGSRAGRLPFCGKSVFGRLTVDLRSIRFRSSVDASRRESRRIHQNR